jgi:hypothetical protein
MVWGFLENDEPYHGLVFLEKTVNHGLVFLEKTVNHGMV